MKYNRKNRALSYIRKKNDLNKGEAMYLYSKCVDGQEEKEFEYLEKLKLIEEKKYKMKLKTVKKWAGNEFDDFERGLKTVIIKVVKDS